MVCSVSLFVVLAVVKSILDLLFRSFHCFSGNFSHHVLVSSLKWSLNFGRSFFIHSRFNLAAFFQETVNKKKGERT